MKAWCQCAAVSSNRDGGGTTRIEKRHTYSSELMPESSDGGIMQPLTVPAVAIVTALGVLLLAQGVAQGVAQLPRQHHAAA